MRPNPRPGRPRPGQTGGWPLVAVVLVLVLVVVLAGCASGGSGPSAGPVRVPSGEPEVAWTPRVRVPPVTLSEEEKQSLRLRSLEEERVAYGLPPMEFPALRRWVYPAELASVTVPCLRDRGFVVTARPDGTGIHAAMQPSQDQAFGRALVECHAEYSVDPRVELQVFTREKSEVVYAYYTEFLIPCLRGRGVEVSDLPSKEVWLASMTPLQGYPHDDAVIAKACPYSPPTKWLLGEG